MEEFSELKSARLLSIYARLLNGRVLKKTDLAQEFGVTARSIQRDLESLRSFLSNEMLPQDVVYDRAAGGYRLTDAKPACLSNSEILAVCKILLESRSMRRDEMLPILDKLVSCICVQFTGVATYHSAALQSAVQMPVTVNDYGQLVGNDGPWKLFSGVINWFFCAAQTIQNRQGHLLSDMAGTKQAVENQRSGAGLPGGFLSTLEELSTLPCMQDAKFSRKLRSAYMNGIGTKESQVDLGVLNSLFEGASNKLDVRTERAVSHNLQRQAWPALLNTVLVRACYFIRQFIRQMKEKKSLAELDWKALIPANNRTVTRMLTIATGTFMAVDLTDAAIRAVAESKGQPALFVPSLVLRINFVGIGRFVIAIGTDVGMGLRRASLNQHRLKLYEQQLSLMLDTRFYYQLDSAWVAVERADQIIGEMEAVTRRNAFKYLAAVSGEIAVHANAIAVTAQQMGRQAAETNAPLQRAADASERTQRLLTAAEEKQKMLEQLLEELK